MTEIPRERWFPRKPEPMLRVYAYSIDEKPGQLKVGQTKRSNVNIRIKEQLSQVALSYEVEVDESAEKPDGTFFSDHELRTRLKKSGFDNPQKEWMVCTAADVHEAINEIRTGKVFEPGRYQTFAMRAEQGKAVEKTSDYFRSIWSEDEHKTPRFLWNAKMRYGKTFAAYQLAKKIDARKVLVATFKPAVEDAWQSDLSTHVDFDGWQFFSKANDDDPSTADPDRPLVYFGSFQDLLGKDPKTGQIKAKNKWIHEENWDLVIFDEYHFGAWRESVSELFEGEEDLVSELKNELSSEIEVFHEEFGEFNASEDEFLPDIGTKAYLYLSGTPFRALSSGEFVEEQIFNWTYTDEQRAKREFSETYPDRWNPYAALPELRLMTYKMPDELIAVASQGEFNEFDLNTFFEATGTGEEATFRFKNDVQSWLNIIRGSHLPTQQAALKEGSRPPFPFASVDLLPHTQHSFWFLHSVSSCHAMANLLREKQNTFWHDYEVITAAGSKAGMGAKALPPVRAAIGRNSKTITLSCAKLTTGVTIPQWSSILMLKNLSSPETYFQAAFRVQSPWSIMNPEGDDPDREEVLKPVGFIFDFAPTRALRQISEYGKELHPNEPNPEDAVKELVSFLPVLAYDGSNMVPLDAGDILDISTSGTSATLLARKWQSAILVNVDNDTLRKIMENEDAFEAISKIEGFRALGREEFEIIINRSEAIRKTKKNSGEKLTPKERRVLTQEERDIKKRRKQIQEKLIKFATRIPAFMYLTDFRENTLKDVITKLEPGLFREVTGLTVNDFGLLVSLGAFNATQMNQAVFSFRRYEDSSLSYTGVESHEGLRKYGLYDTVVAVKEDQVKGSDSSNTLEWPPEGMIPGDWKTATWLIPGQLAGAERPGRKGPGDNSQVEQSKVDEWIEAAKNMDPPIKSIICLLDDDQLALYKCLDEHGGLIGYYSREFEVENESVKHPDDYGKLPEEKISAASEAFGKLPKPVLVHCSAAEGRTRDSINEGILPNHF